VFFVSLWPDTVITALTFSDSSFADVFEEKMAHPRIQVLFFLTQLAAILFFLGSAFYAVGGYHGRSWYDLTMEEAVWQAWTLVMDAGVEYNTKHFNNRIIAGLTTVVGVLFAAVMTAVIVDAVKHKLEG